MKPRARDGFLAVSALLARGEHRQALELARQFAADLGRPPHRLHVVGPVLPATLVDGCPLCKGMRAEQCVARQQAGDKPRRDPSRDLVMESRAPASRHDGKRGVAPREQAHCITGRCPIGEDVRRRMARSPIPTQSRGARKKT